MEAGRLRQKITFQKRGEGTDSFGQPKDWVDLATGVHAEILPIGGREKLRAMAYESTLTHTVMIRFRADLSTVIEADGWRILHGARVFDITSARNVGEEKKALIFDCIETGVEHGQAG